MRVKFLMCLVSVALGLVAFKAQAQDDAYVDLSVLNDLGSASGPMMHSEPLFPIVKKSVPASPVVKTKAPAKAIVKKEVAISNKQPEARKLKIKQTEVVKKEISNTPEVIDIPTKPADINLPAEAKGIFGVEEIVVEKPVAPAPVVDIVAEPMEAPREFVAAVKTDGTQSILPREDQSVMPESVIKEITAETPVVPEEKPIVEEEKKIEPLIPVNTENVSNTRNVLNQIIFDNDTYELSPANQEKVSSIIAGFEDAKTNKIAILAYNYDNGEDVFKKKRQSLNRAIEIRSYLLNKGYKNFSIKVINISDDASKGNAVEIEEIK